MGEQAEGGNISHPNLAEYRYDKETMLELIGSPASHERPACLSHEFDKYCGVNLKHFSLICLFFSEVGLWNPELWINNVWHNESPPELDRGQQGDRRPLRSIGRIFAAGVMLFWVLSDVASHRDAR